MWAYDSVVKSFLLSTSSIFLTESIVSLASLARLVDVIFACLDRYCGGRGLPVTAFPLWTDNPLPCGWYLNCHDHLMTTSRNLRHFKNDISILFIVIEWVDA